MRIEAGRRKGFPLGQHADASWECRLSWWLATTRKSPTRGIALQLLREKPRGVFHEDRVGGVQLGKGLLVLALDHDLRLGRHGGAAMSIRSSNHRQSCPSASSTEIRATERCEWGVASWLRISRACSLSSSEQGQVEE
jgi:hypothetical protein